MINRWRREFDGPTPATIAARSPRRWLRGVTLAIVLLMVLAWRTQNLNVEAKAPAKTFTRNESVNPRALDELLAIPVSTLEKCDVALMNLLCTQCLPGTEDLNPEDCLATLDQWAQHVRLETERHFYRFRQRPSDYENSEGYFRMLIMAVVLYEDFGVRYHPGLISNPAPIDAQDRFFADARDVFLPGLLGVKRMGTCSSMPVLYAALGRRLGYPLKLVTTKAHLFLRWEGKGEKFNLEATGRGMNRYDDEHFKQWPFPVSAKEIAADGYLKSLTAAEELAVFLSIRGHCLMEAGRVGEAIQSYAEAAKLAPDSRGYRLLSADVQRRLGFVAGVPVQAEEQQETKPMQGKERL